MFTLPRSFAITLLITCFTLTFSACSSDDGDDGGGGSTTRASAIAALTGDQAAGKTLYLSKCSACHKADGTGNNGPNLMSGSKAMLSMQAMATTVVDGTGSMPSFGTMSNQEIADIVSYVKGDLAGTK